MGKRRAKRSKQKPRTQAVILDMGEPVAPDLVEVDPRTGRVTFFKHGVPLRPVSAASEVSYERENKQKGRKIVAQAPLRSDRLWINADKALLRFDHIFAIDTNTRESNGELISVAGIVHARATQVIIPGGAGIEYNLNCCIEFRGIKGKVENYVWMCFIMSLRQNPNYHPSSQIGIVVDSDLGNLQNYNLRNMPICDDFYLPGNMKFVYASSDTGGNAANTLLRFADKEAKRLLSYIIRERCDEGLIPLVGKACTHYKK